MARRPAASALRPMTATAALLASLLIGAAPAPALAAPALAAQPAAAPAAGESSAGDFVAATPTRIVDTRSGLGAGGPINGGSNIDVAVLGQAGVPGRDVGAVVLNVTATGATAPAALTVYPTGTAKPPTSTLNIRRGVTVANLAVTEPGSDGRVRIFASGKGTVDVVVDVVGWFTTGVPAPGRFRPLTPSRLLDTRGTTGAHPGPLEGGETAPLQVTGHGGVPANVSAAVLVNVTATAATRAGYVSLYPSTSPRPATSTLTYANDTVATLALVQLGEDGAVNVENSTGGSVHLIVDVLGVVLGGQTGAPGTIAGLSPARLLDTRRSTDGAQPLDPGGTRILRVTGAGGVPARGVGAAIVTVTATGAGANGFVTAYAGARARPSVSSVNYRPKATVSNTSIVPLGAGGRIAVTNTGTNTVHLIVDVVGYVRAPDVAYSSVSAGDRHTCAVTRASAVSCWGDNSSGQLGHAITYAGQAQDFPAAVQGLPGRALQVVAGYDHTCALLEGGAVFCWGGNFQGQLGNGTRTASSRPVAVIGLESGVTKLLAGPYMDTCALLATGTVACWGLDGGSQARRLAPEPVVGMTGGVTDLVGGWSYPCAVIESGRVDCSDGWDTAPATVTNLPSRIDAITGNVHHSCALSRTVVRCWGADDDGELGTGEVGSVGQAEHQLAVEATVARDLDGPVLDVAAQPQGTCVLVASGLQCWGRNEDGQLGDGTTTMSLTPRPVLHLPADVVDVSASSGHTCAVTSDGRLWCWGRDVVGELGLGRAGFLQTQAGQVLQP